MPWLSSDDVVETYSKLRQRGWAFVLQKLRPDAQARTLSAFNAEHIEAANWWLLPAVRARWNAKITGDPARRYEDHLLARYAAGREGLRLLSLGAGACSHELYLAERGPFAEVLAVDIADKLLAKAAAEARAKGLAAFRTLRADVHGLALPAGHYDMVLFHSALHHFSGVERLLLERVAPALRPGGLVIINEYVGPRRLQWPPQQIAAINAALRRLPAERRRRLKTGWLKRRVSGPGRLRMWLADPSECVESDRILPVLRQHFQVLEEKPYGGNLLMPLLKDIAQHFLDPAAAPLLAELFAAEDAYLAEGWPSDFMFGVYGLG